MMLAPTLLLAALSATAVPTGGRLAIVASSDVAIGQQTLRYAQQDADRMGVVLRDLGGFNRVVTLHNPTPDELRRAFDAAEIWTAGRAGAELVFYYSGHADPLGLLLGGSRFLFQELRDRVERSKAAVRVALLDACHAGEAIRPKGGHPGPAFSLEALAPRDLRGAAIVAASTASEFAQESSLIEGSYFTHHLLSALRGAADQDRNGAVTLAEAYRYTYARTVAATAPSVWGAQHPSYEYNLAGTGELILTRMAVGQSGVVLPEAAGSATYYLQNQTGELVAEVVPPPRQRVRVAMPVGKYRLVSLEPGRAYAAEVQVASGGDVVVERSQLRQISLDTALSKGGRGRNNDVFLELALAGLGHGVFSGSGELGLGWWRRGLHWSYGLRGTYGRAENTVSTVNYQLKRGRLTADLVRRMVFGPAELQIGGGVGAVLIHESLNQRRPQLQYSQYATAPSAVGWLAVEVLPRPWLPVRLTWGGALDAVQVDGSRRLLRELRGSVSAGLRF